MQPISRVEFGPDDAGAFDKFFIDKYVEENNFKILSDNLFSIITGEKGSGKTALVKGINIFHKSKYTHIVNINFGDLSFSAIADRILKIHETSNIDALYLMVNYWKYSFVTEAMKVIIDNKKLHLLPIESDMYNYLVNNDHMNEHLSTRLLNLSDKIVKILEFVTKPKKNNDNNGLLGGITTADLEKIKNFPLKTDKFPALSSEFAEYLSNKQITILITLDGLDILRVEKREDFKKLQLIFEGLIAATYHISTSEKYSTSILLKSLIPYDIYLSLNPRDLDKYDEKSSKIRWDYYSLQEFLRKRITFSIDFKREVTFENAWHEIMPKKLSNTHVDLEENSFDYLLRHTLYRPRQLQVHMQTLSQEYRDINISSDMINDAIVLA